jgi:hypothetical protein
VPHLLRHGTSVFKIISERRLIFTSVLVTKEQSLPILNVLGLKRRARAGLGLMTSWMLSESTTTRLPQPVIVLLYNYSHRRRSIQEYINLKEAYRLRAEKKHIDQAPKLKATIFTLLINKVENILIMI